MPERKLLCAVFDNIDSWKKKAVHLITHAKHTLYTSELMNQFCTEVAIEEVKVRIILATDNLLADLRSISDEGKALGFELSELETISRLVTVTEWSLKLSHLLLERPSIEVIFDLMTRKCKRGLVISTRIQSSDLHFVQELDFLLQEADAFQDHFAQFQQLQCVVSKAQDWFQKLRTTLHQQDPELKCSVNELESLLLEAKVCELVNDQTFEKI